MEERFLTGNLNDSWRSVHSAITHQLAVTDDDINCGLIPNLMHTAVNTVTPISTQSMNLAE